MTIIGITLFGIVGLVTFVRNGLRQVDVALDTVASYGEDA
jgi:hypothetical protein